MATDQDVQMTMDVALVEAEIWKNGLLLNSKKLRRQIRALAKKNGVSSAEMAKIYKTIIMEEFSRSMMVLNRIIKTR